MRVSSERARGDVKKRVYLYGRARSADDDDDDDCALVRAFICQDEIGAESSL